MGLPSEEQLPLTSVEYIDTVQHRFPMEKGKFKSGLVILRWAREQECVDASGSGHFRVTQQFKEFFARAMGAQITKDCRKENSGHKLAHLIMYGDQPANIYFHHDPAETAEGEIA